MNMVKIGLLHRPALAMWTNSCMTLTESCSRHHRHSGTIGQIRAVPRPTSTNQRACTSECKHLHVLHAAARFVLDLRPRDHVTVALQTLHWLPVCQRITYKLCVLMHGVAFDYAPTYLRDVVVPLWTMPGRAHLRSAGVNIGWSQSFLRPGPLAWNQLPASLRSMNCIKLSSVILKLSCLKQHMA